MLSMLPRSRTSSAGSAAPAGASSVGAGDPTGEDGSAGGATGALLLPLMLYHALQIVLASIMAQQFGQAAQRAEALAGIPPSPAPAG